MQKFQKTKLGLLCGVAFALILSGNAQALNLGLNELSTNPQTSHNIHSVSQQRATGAENFIRGVAKRGIEFLSNPDLNEYQKTTEFRKLLKSSFDINAIARFSLGRYWRAASAKEQKEYLKLFEKMIIEVYSRRFNEYQGQQVDIIDVSEKSKDNYFVNTTIIPEAGPEFKVEWRVRYRDGRYKIIDVIVEGVSMAVTYRSDFSSVIQRGGGKVGVLLEHLRG